MTTEHKRALITDREQLAIAGYVAGFPDMQRTALAERILAEVKWPGKPPELEVLERKISLLRNHPIDGPQDKPWSMAALDKYPKLGIESPSPEAISALIGIWKFRREQAKAVAGQWSSDMQEQPFTIREAKWSARLSALFKDDLEKLSDVASRYARLELIYQLLDRPFDSTIADTMLLLEQPIVGKREDEFELFLQLLAGREDAVDQIRDMKEGKRTSITIGKQKKEAQDEGQHKGKD